MPYYFILSLGLVLSSSSVFAESTEPVATTDQKTSEVETENSAKDSAQKEKPKNESEKITISKPTDEANANIVLSEKDQWIYDRGKIGTAAYIIGGVVGSYTGFGIGHAIQGRYKQRGWIFTVSELGALSITVAGAAQCLQYYRNSSSSQACDAGGNFISLGLIGYLGLRVWEIVDLWAYPPSHNKRFQKLQSRQSSWELKPLIDVSQDGHLLLGANLTF